MGLLQRTDSSTPASDQLPRRILSSPVHAVNPPTQRSSTFLFLFSFSLSFLFQIILMTWSSVLERLHQFLPQIHADNAALLQRAQAHPDSVSIELPHHPGHAHYIEMVCNPLRPSNPPRTSELTARLYSALIKTLYPPRTIEFGPWRL